MILRDLIKKLSDTDLDKKIDVAAWREEKKKISKKFSDTEKAFFRGFLCRDSKYPNSNAVKTKELTRNLPIPDAGATMRELFGEIPDTELDEDIDNKIAKWRGKHSYYDRAFLRLFIGKKDGKNYIPLAEVEIPDNINQIDSSSKDNMNSKKETGLYIPTKEDFEKAYRKLEKTHKQEVPIDEVLDIVEANLTEKGRMLHENWRSITEQNIATWSREGD